MAWIRKPRQVFFFFFNSEFDKYTEAINTMRTVSLAVFQYSHFLSHPSQEAMEVM